MNLFKSKILKSRKSKLTLFLVFALVFVVVPKFVYAGPLDMFINFTQNAVASLIGYILDIFISIIGVFLGLLIKVIVSFSSYNNFIHEPAVQEGWKIVSSFCNMFFILIVLVIAFANILNIDSYRIKSTLPKVIIMAILINFSLMICGLLIDFSQIFMMTFVNAIGTSGGEYVKVFQINTYFEEVKNNKWTGEINLISSIIGMVGALVFMLMAFVVLFYVLIIIIMRIVMLWIYSILSPFAFVLSAFPAGKPYASKWWDRFTKELIAGPVLMFFVWLAFYMVGHMANLTSVSTSVECVGPYEMFCPEKFLPIIMAIALLVGGLKITQEIGGVTGGLAGSAMNRVQQGRGLLQKGASNFGGLMVDKASEKARMNLNPVRAFRRMTTEMSSNKAARESRIYNATLDSMDDGGSFRSAAAHVMTGDLAYRSFTNMHKNNFAGLKRFNMGGKAYNKEAEKRGAKVEELEKERENILTPDENSRLEKKFVNLEASRDDINKQIETKDLEVALNPPGEDREKARKELDSLKEKSKQVNEKIEFHKEKYKGKNVDKDGAEKLDGEIETAENERKDWNKYQVSGMTSARAQSLSELESEGLKLTANIEGSERLAPMFVEAVSNEMPGLASIIAKKIAKNGDYNELQKYLGLGTGLEGMKGLGSELEKSGLSKQSSLGVLADVGSITKNMGHFGGYGAVTMKNGKMDYANNKQYESAKLAEMLKMQPQQFARAVNRLGLGTYKGGKHTLDNWTVSPAALAYLKLNNEAVGDNYLKTGQQNALEHLASAAADLKAAGIEENSVLMKNMNYRTERAKGDGADVELMIDQIRSGLDRAKTKDDS